MWFLVGCDTFVAKKIHTCELFFLILHLYTNFIQQMLDLGIGFRDS